MLIVYAVMYI